MNARAVGKPPVTKPPVTKPTASKPAGTKGAIVKNGMTLTQLRSSRIHNPLEATEGIMFMREARSRIRLYPEIEFLHHIANEAKRGQFNTFSAQGLLSGVPDYHMPLPRGGFAGWYGELKRMYDNGPSAEQWRMMLYLRAHGYYCNWHRGNLAMWQDLEQYLKQSSLKPGERRKPQPPLRIEALWKPPVKRWQDPLPPELIIKKAIAKTIKKTKVTR